MRNVSVLIIGLVLISLSVCGQEIEPGVMKSDLTKDVELITDLGSIVFRLSDETPLHRNNFIKLVNNKTYKNVAFHRVIEGFLIQTGDIETKYTDVEIERGIAEKPYTIDAEVTPNLFHKRGAINAARMGDDYNPKQASSGTQFTIIQGRTYSDSTLAVAEKRITKWMAYNKVINCPEHQAEFDKLFSLSNQMEDNEINDIILDSVSLRIITDSIAVLKSRFDSLAVKEQLTMKGYRYPEQHRKVYKNVGGAAHLDQNYTVFGQVVKGMDIVDKIAEVQTNDKDEPLNNIRIISAKMIKRNSYD